MSRLDRVTLAYLDEAVAALDAGFAALPGLPAPAEPEAIREVLLEAARRLGDNDPYFHPLYAGQMLKPPHPVARLAYALALWINPNNHALDGGRASSAMEKEAVATLARLFRWETHLGHLCGGGTMANLEALWVSRELRPGAVVASAQAHYTHRRLSGLLGVPFCEVAVDDAGRMDVDDLERALRAMDVSVVVATLGSTALGAVDPLPEVLERARQAGARVHVDAAYGGYFTLASSLGARARRAFDALDEVDSLVVDPHKHGLQPYGCGCVLFRDATVGPIYRHESPYTYFSSDDLHLGEISLECSRPGAAAVALWATQRLLPYEPGGAFATDLDRCLEAARVLHARLAAHPRFVPIVEPELDIVVFAVDAPTAAEAGARARAIFRRAQDEALWLALATLPRALVAPRMPRLATDGQDVLCLRACLMKPEHANAVDDLLRRLERIA